jgi:hypothetical protein
MQQEAIDVGKLSQLHCPDYASSWHDQAEAKISQLKKE